MKQVGWKLNESDNSIIIGKQRYRYAESREIMGNIKILTIKRDALGDIYLYFVCETSENKVLARTGKSVGFDFGQIVAAKIKRSRILKSENGFVLIVAADIIVIEMLQ